MTTSNKQLGFWSLTALVAGNMIGSGIFLLPSNLAHIGSISLLSWIFTSIGALILAIIFSRTSLLLPKTGGPYAYAKEGFGKFIGFQTAYNYWICIWVGNAAITIALVGYLTVFWGALENHIIASLVAILAVWLLTLVNIIGVRSIGIIQIITTVLKLIPIFLVAILGWWYFHPEYLIHSFNITSSSNFSAISTGASLTLWAFLGLESATVPAENVHNPKRNIPLATIVGTLIAACTYIASSTAIMGMIPADKLATSYSPFAAAASIMFGNWGKWLIAAGAAISCFGCLNGWILLQGQVAMAAADDGLFPSIFAKRNKAGLPAHGLIITSILISLLLIFTADSNLINQFELIILTATLASLIPYLYTTIAYLIIADKQSLQLTKTKIAISLLGALYSFWVIFGAGKVIVFYGSILMLTCVPLYALIATKKQPSL